MKVIFLKDIPGTADAGQVKNVKNGFARNYLLPRNLAAPATADQLQRLKAIEAAAHETRLKESQEWTTVAKELAGRTITIEARVGPTGRLFGSVTTRNIVDEVNKLTERNLDHRQIHLHDAIHAPGNYPVTVRLYREVEAPLVVSVVPEGAQEAAAAVNEEEAAVAEAEVETAEAASEAEEEADTSAEEDDEA